MRSAVAYFRWVVVAAFVFGAVLPFFAGLGSTDTVPRTHERTNPSRRSELEACRNVEPEPKESRLGHCDYLPATDGLAPEQTTPTLAKLVESRESALLLGQNRTLPKRLPAWLLMTSRSRSAFEQCSIQIRFCTWLT